ncbi:hypothetical protein F5B20DRAFT_16705 [Whalleya microplaca]|nr:hypothetical protein F5B20DRAFT_16705 [Whalleya microplaca]
MILCSLAPCLLSWPGWLSLPACAAVACIFLISTKYSQQDLIGLHPENPHPHLGDLETYGFSPTYMTDNLSNIRLSLSSILTTDPDIHTSDLYLISTSQHHAATTTYTVEQEATRANEDGYVNTTKPQLILPLPTLN